MKVLLLLRVRAHCNRLVKNRNPITLVALVFVTWTAFFISPHFQCLDTYIPPWATMGDARSISHRCEVSQCERLFLMANRNDHDGRLWSSLNASGSVSPSPLGNDPKFPPQTPPDPFDKVYLTRLYWSLSPKERDEQFLTPDDVAGILGKSTTRVRALVSEGKLPAIKPTGRICIYWPGVLQSWLKQLSSDIN
jgi:hypothetical protein